MSWDGLLQRLLHLLRALRPVVLFTSSALCPGMGCYIVFSTSRSFLPLAPSSFCCSPFCMLFLFLFFYPCSLLLFIHPWFLVSSPPGLAMLYLHLSCCSIINPPCDDAVCCGWYKVYYWMLIRLQFCLGKKQLKLTRHPVSNSALLSSFYCL